ncbi:MAG: arginine--tRNA ligase [Alphaproteobacteria bacterium]
MLADLFAHYETIVRAALEGLGEAGDLPSDLDYARVVVETPREAAHGHLATNAALVLAKPAGMAPRKIAELLAAKLRGTNGIETVEIAGPGFLNMTLGPQVWHRVLKTVLRQGLAYGAVDIGQGAQVNVEYVSANPTGPMHVGHCRGAVVGDVLAAMLARAGYAVTKEYYINDAGGQIEVLARSVFLRYREALGEDIGAIPQGLYPGDYLVPVGEHLAKTHGAKLGAMAQKDWMAIVAPVAIAQMLELIKTDLESLNVAHDVYFSEKSLTADVPGGNQIEAALATLKDMGLIYQGRLPKPKGRVPAEWEDREQTLFRSTQFGDDVDRALLKSDGGYTYFASDIAYHFDKYSRGFAQQIDVWGADHGGYVKRMQAAVTAISGGKAALDVKICQLVRLLRAGEPVKMSKRSGNFVTLREVVEEVGRDPVRFMMVYRKNDAPLDFDFDKVTEQSRDNPVFYVQYAHARICSVFRKAGDTLDGAAMDMGGLETCDFSKLVDRSEIQLMARLGAYPRMFESAARAHEPHRIAFYLYDLASDFHSAWNRGTDLPQLRFIQPTDMDTSLARLALIRGVAYVLSSGLEMLGVSAPHELS